MLLDSNIVIYAVKPEYPEVRAFIKQHDATASILTRIETLGYHDLSSEEAFKLNRLFDLLGTQPITESIVTRSVTLRQRRKGLTTIDAVIAATALQRDIPLATHDIDDFRWITELDLVDPLPQP
jgi:predicted nucleic acid-binding protein